MRAFVHLITAQNHEHPDRGDRNLRLKPQARTSRRRFGLRRD